MRRALGLIEFIVAVIILALLAALAIPRLSGAAPTGANPNVRGNLNVLRLAIELYQQEHGAYPGQRGDGINAAGSSAAVVNQLTRFTNARGDVSETRDAAHPLGPYLRLGVPPCPVPPRADRTGIVLTEGRPGYIEAATEAGWVYNCRTGDIAMNSDAKDAQGVRYDRY